MSRALLAFAFVAAAGGSALADDTRVHTHASVEVLDDKAQIDDVISRMKAQQATEARPTATNAATALKDQRPPAPTSDTAHRAVAPEVKDQRPGTRRPNRERNGNPDHTERPRVRRR